jgi:hypothetical protein
MKFMLADTHISLEDALPLIYIQELSRSAHFKLEKIVLYNCGVAMVTDYGLTEESEEDLNVANTDETSFLLQGEIYSI